jgi:aminoglycoside/choline kinase family phosphotransferase
VEEADGAHWWLFLEDAGEEQYSTDAREHRCLAGRWLGMLHGALGSPAANARLPDRGPSHYLQCLRATRDCLREQLACCAASAEELAMLTDLGGQCEIVEGYWDQVEQFCAGMPRTLVHGDFSNKNVRVRAVEGETTLLVYDWESAGLGVPAVDLAHSPLAAPHFAAQADLTAYWEAVREYWPRIDLHTIEQWANLGTLFRCLAALNWDVRSLRRGWAQTLLERAGFYHAVLAHTLRDPAWVS